MIKLLAQITILRRTLLGLLCKMYLGKDFTPFDYTPDEVACAEATTTILKMAGMFPRIITGTYTLYDALNKDKNWTVTNNPQEGDIVISPTGLGSKTMRGHVGIVGPNGLIYSNDSYTGLWATHYTIDTWTKRYKGQGGYPVLFYTYISIL